jgi:hypothetical protein
MDDIVVRSLAKWPNVPAVYGWLELDRRGNWRIKGGKITNSAFREFIARNYAADELGRWFFQNGPQRVYVTLAYAPFVLHFQGEQLFDHCGRAVRAVETWVDDEGSVLIRVENGVGLLDDRDLARYADEAERLPRIARAEVPGRFGFVSAPQAA